MKIFQKNLITQEKILLSFDKTPRFFHIFAKLAEKDWTAGLFQPGRN